MDRSLENVLAVGSIVIAAALMMPTLWAGPLVLDEHAAFWLSASDVPLPIWERSFGYAAAPPLASWAQAASMTVLGETELALRLPSMAAYILAVGVLAFAGRPVIGGFAAALSACVLALHPDVVDEVRVGRTYGLVLLWVTLLLIITLRWRVAKIGWKDGCAWGIVAAAAVWTHILTIPVAGMSALMLGYWDAYRSGSLRIPTVLGWLLAGLLCAPLLPMGERIWQWQAALNYQTGDVTLQDAVGPFVWLGLPLAAVIVTVVLAAGRLFGHSAKAAGTPRETTSPSPALWPSAMATAIALGLVPLLILVAVGQGELSSLSNPRYRVPLAPANACLLGLICCRLPRRSLAAACAAIALATSWTAVGRMPTDIVRLNTPQAIVWKEMAETLEQVVDEQHLEAAPVFVQSGLIEGTLIPAFPDDLLFHGYVSSRLGRFYARTPNPRYALPLLWGGDNTQLLQFFTRTLEETAASTPHELFVAVATDTDVNRLSFAAFVRLLEQFGYEGTPIAGDETWGLLYHYQRPIKPPPR